MPGGQTLSFTHSLPLSTVPGGQMQVGVQALRLEYYELFSRIFVEEGRPFRPWHVAIVAGDEMKEPTWVSG